MIIYISNTNILTRSHPHLVRSVEDQVGISKHLSISNLRKWGAAAQSSPVHCHGPNWKDDDSISIILHWLITFLRHAGENATAAVNAWHGLLIYISGRVFPNLHPLHSRAWSALRRTFLLLQAYSGLSAENIMSVLLTSSPAAFQLRLFWTRTRRTRTLQMWRWATSLQLFDAEYYILYWSKQVWHTCCSGWWYQCIVVRWR